MASFKNTGSIRDFKQFTDDVYSLPDDRRYSIHDLLVQQQRFVMRALKGIRKGDIEKLKLNLLIALSFSMLNRLHIDIEDEVWKRFPYLCSYCGNKPCICKKIKPHSRLKIKINNSLRPKTLAGFQKMFDEIYPADSRTLADAGVHLAEEMGEVSEAIHNYLGQHQEKQFDQIKFELADFISCVFGVANSAKIDVAQELVKMFNNGCHICHRTPCICSYPEVAKLKT